mgnify:CR=1 FL=1
MRKAVATLVLVLLAAVGLSAQNVSDLIISEALAEPDSTGILDDYGRRLGWVELFNKSTGTVNYGGCFLTDDRSNLKKSIIPKSDLRTKLGPRQSVMLFCSGNGSDGTYYADFTLSPGKTVYLVSNDGRTIIDSLRIPANLPAGKSVAKLAFDLRQQEFEAQEEPSIPSPGMLNGNQNASSKAQEMAKNDPHGWILTVVSVSVVFAALAILWFLFWLFFDRPAKKAVKAKEAPKKAVAKGTPEGEVAAAIALALEMEHSGDDYAAIATAVHLYLNDAVHDVEPGFLTIRRSPSAWDDKKQTFRKLPR